MKKRIQNPLLTSKKILEKTKQSSNVNNAQLLFGEQRECQVIIKYNTNYNGIIMR